MRSILAGLLATACGSAQEGEPQAFPTDLGISESEIVTALVPEHPKTVCEWEAGGVPAEDAEIRAGQVDEWLRTDFGLAGRVFVVASVTGEQGNCAQCSFVRIGVFELSVQAPIFRFERSGMGPHPSLRVFRLVPGDPVLTLAFQTGEGSLNLGGYSRNWDEWYRPELAGDRQVNFVKIWSGLANFAMTDNSTWVTQTACAAMQRVEGRRRYRREVRSRYGHDGASPASEDLRSGTDNCGCSWCGVEIRRDQLWNLNAQGKLHEASETVRRVDRFPVDVFPFNLPQRTRAFHRRRGTTPARFGGQPDMEVDSPSGAWTLQWNAPGLVSNTLRVIARDGSVKRSVDLPIPSADKRDRSALRTVSSLGWQVDERRIFAILELGLEDKALVSYALDGRGDYWEEALPARGEAWPLGFVLEPAKKK